VMLHYLDDLDSKMESMRAHFEREAELESPWTSYNSSLGRPLLNTAKLLAPKSTPVPETQVVVAQALETTTDPALDVPGDNGNAAAATAVAAEGHSKVG